MRAVKPMFSLAGQREIPDEMLGVQRTGDQHLVAERLFPLTLRRLDLRLQAGERLFRLRDVVVERL